MTKRIESQFKQIRSSRDKIRFSLGTLSLVTFCTFLIIIATFTQLSFFHYVIPLDIIFHPIKFFSNHSNSIIQVKYCEYIPQIPVLAYIAALLGPVYSLIAVFIYILLGLTFFPVFALGGGISYVLQYNFGYILAYLPAVFVICRVLRKNFSYKSIAKASFLGVLVIHITGILYTIILALFKGESYNFILDWIAAQSLSKILYDFIFSFLAIILARITKKILWVVMG